MKTKLILSSIALAVLAAPALAGVDASALVKKNTEGALRSQRAQQYFITGSHIPQKAPEGRIITCAGSAVRIVTSDDISSGGATTVTGALRNIPSVFVRRR